MDSAATSGPLNLNLSRRQPRWPLRRLPTLPGVRVASGDAKSNLTLVFPWSQTAETNARSQFHFTRRPNYHCHILSTLSSSQKFIAYLPCPAQDKTKCSVSQDGVMPWPTPAISASHGAECRYPVRLDTSVRMTVDTETHFPSLERHAVVRPRRLRHLRREPGVCALSVATETGGGGVFPIKIHLFAIEGYAAVRPRCFRHLEREPGVYQRRAAGEHEPPRQQPCGSQRRCWRVNGRGRTREASVSRTISRERGLRRCHSDRFTRGKVGIGQQLQK